VTQRAIDPGTEEGWRVIDAAVRSARARLGDGLLSAYAIGSLAHGGFTPSVSDVDLALLTDSRTDRDTGAVVAAITADVRAANFSLGDRLSVFHTPWDRFADPPPDARFPPIDRYDLVRYGILVDGRDLRDDSAAAPGADEIREQAVDSALSRVSPEQLRAELRRLEDGGVSVHDATKTVLWPVRLQHVCDTGQATGNSAAVDHYVQISDARHVPLVSDALAWREQPVVPDAPATLRRISDEIADLHAEVFERLGRRRGIPRADEITERARQLAATTPSGARRSRP
jgi:predicted nucleotidyltransferase